MHRTRSAGGIVGVYDPELIKDIVVDGDEHTKSMVGSCFILIHSSRQAGGTGAGA